MTIIDIGANIGDTAAIVRQYVDRPILCIEADPYYFDLLRHNVARAGMQSVEIVKAFISINSGEMKGRLVAESGTAHFEGGLSGSVDTCRLSSILQEHPKFDSARVVKIDTDGLDCSILASELKWLARRRPLVFFEYDPFFFREHGYDGKQIFADMKGIGYRSAIFYDNFGNYLTTLDMVRDGKILADLQDYFLGRGGQLYADIALFHADDEDVVKELSPLEAEWSRTHR